jgi:predicted RNase H-like HicB family nuclease
MSPEIESWSGGLQSHLGQHTVELDRLKAKLSEKTGRSVPKANVKEITFEIERDEENGWLTASWDAPRGQGGITTQGKDIRELEQNVREAVSCHLKTEKCQPGFGCTLSTIW